MIYTIGILIARQNQLSAAGQAPAKLSRMDLWAETGTNAAAWPFRFLGVEESKLGFFHCSSGWEFRPKPKLREAALPTAP